MTYFRGARAASLGSTPSMASSGRAMTWALMTSPDSAAAAAPASMAALTAAMNQVKQATDRAQPQDIVDLLVTEPVILRVLPTETK